MSDPAVRHLSFDIRHSREAGSILVYTMLTMAAMLAIGLTLNGIFVSKLRAAGATRNATVALYAADSGTELCLYAARTATPGLRLEMENGATVTVKNLTSGADVTDCADPAQLDPNAIFIQVIGEYRRSARALEVSF